MTIKQRGRGGRLERVWLVLSRGQGPQADNNDVVLLHSGCGGPCPSLLSGAHRWRPPRVPAVMCRVCGHQKPQGSGRSGPAAHHQPRAGRGVDDGAPHHAEVITVAVERRAGGRKSRQKATGAALRASDSGGECTAGRTARLPTAAAGAASATSHFVIARYLIRTAVDSLASRHAPARPTGRPLFSCVHSERANRMLLHCGQKKKKKKERERERETGALSYGGSSAVWLQRSVVKPGISSARARLCRIQRRERRLGFQSARLPMGGTLDGASKGKTGPRKKRRNRHENKTERVSDLRHVKSPSPSGHAHAITTPKKRRGVNCVVDPIPQRQLSSEAKKKALSGWGSSSPTVCPADKPAEAALEVLA
ncbi:hypothetical protein B0J12DRAFT_414956 [Macrophomina phaseolina]|uniref:Uncharacterized protein n=1 Tax=Macrophomina phaseolina TaxID=35725 RepID=A0ABQ8FRS5_9PEZI|nr:hypothetical protein B0J12DRAFT_414956 [Macrophomina phaseolina]